MRHCAFLTMDTLEGYVSDDELVYAPLQKLGWQVTPVSWRKSNHDWSQYDAVLIRTTWDYHREPDYFLNILETVHTSGPFLLNSLDIVRWNIRKTYLHDLEQRGIRTVPCLWPDRIDREQVYFAFDEFDTNEIIVKPIISAGARHTFHVRSDAPESVINHMAEDLRGRECLIQPFIQNVVTEGEYSVFYFGGAYSHSVLKTPKRHDFRVQEEHGGLIWPVTPDTSLLKSSEQVLKVSRFDPFYARVDWVRNSDGDLNLMELELIEPSLYFRTDPASPARFANAFNTWVSRCQQSSDPPVTID